MSSTALVVARYQERLEWLRRVPATMSVYVYDKDDRPEPREPVALPRTPKVAERLTNLGREAHTYLHHILRRWDSLEDVTVFAQGHPFDHASDFHAVLKGLAAAPEALPESGFRWLGFIIDSDDPRGRRLFVPWSKNEDGRELRTDLFYDALFGAPAPEWLHFYPGGQFVATRAAIHARPRAFYERAFMLAATFPDGAHCFERLWDRVFRAEGAAEAQLDGALCRYLKPVRRGLEPG